MATLDCHGRIADRTILQVLGWPTGHRLTIHETDARFPIMAKCQRLVCAFVDHDRFRGMRNRGEFAALQTGVESVADLMAAIRWTIIDQF
jgi:hypothetical protein